MKTLVLSVALLINAIIGIIVAVTAYAGFGSIIFLLLSIFALVNGIAGIIYYSMGPAVRIIGKLVGTDEIFAKRAVILSLLLLGGTMATSNVLWIISLICTCVVIASARAIHAT